MTTPTVSVVIANFNARDALARGLDALRCASATEPVEIIVVDDGSRDGSASMVRERFPEVRLIVHPATQGYARACNDGVAAASGAFIHFLNNDVEVQPGALDALLTFLRSTPSAGVAGSLLLNGDGSVQISAKALPTLRSAFFGGRSWISRWWPSNPFTKRELLHWQAGAGQPFQAGYVSGASMMVPRPVMDRVGPFDERLFYFNDADFCRRVLDAGFGVFCVPAARSMHLNHQGGSRRNMRQRLRSLFWFHRGAFIYFRTHSGRGPWHPENAVVITALALRFVVTGGLQLLKEVVGVERRVYGHE